MAMPASDSQVARVALKLIQQGYKNVYPLLGGFEAWHNAGYPIEERQN